MQNGSPSAEVGCRRHLGIGMPTSARNRPAVGILACKAARRRQLSAEVCSLPSAIYTVALCLDWAGLGRQVCPPLPSPSRDVGFVRGGRGSVFVVHRPPDRARWSGRCAPVRRQGRIQRGAARGGSPSPVPPRRRRRRPAASVTSGVTHQDPVEWRPPPPLVALSGSAPGAGSLRHCLDGLGKRVQPGWQVFLAAAFSVCARASRCWCGGDSRFGDLIGNTGVS